MTTYMGRLVSVVSSALDVNAATLTGAMDIIVVQHEDGSLQCSPFHVRFGKLKLLRSREKLVSVHVNNEPTDLRLILGSAGEAYFIQSSETPPSADQCPSPVTSPTLKPSAKEPELPLDSNLSIGVSAANASRSSNNSEQVSQQNSTHGLTETGSIQRLDAQNGNRSEVRMDKSATSQVELVSNDMSSKVEVVSQKSEVQQMNQTVSSLPKAAARSDRIAINVSHEINESQEDDGEDSNRTFDSSLSLGQSQTGSNRTRPRKMVRKFSVASELTEVYRIDSLAKISEENELDKSAHVQQRGERVANPETESELDAATSDCGSESQDEESNLLAMSMCRHLLREDMNEETVEAIFDEHRVSYSTFATDPIGILFQNPNLLFRIQDRLVDWKVAAPVIVSLTAFNAPLDVDRVERAVRLEELREKESRELALKRKGKSSFNWFGFGRTAVDIDDVKNPALQTELLPNLDNTEPLQHSAGDGLPKARVLERRSSEPVETSTQANDKPLKQTSSPSLNIGDLKDSNALIQMEEIPKSAEAQAALFISPENTLEPVPNDAEVFDVPENEPPLEPNANSIPALARVLKNLPQPSESTRNMSAVSNATDGSVFDAKLERKGVSDSAIIASLEPMVSTSSAMGLEHARTTNDFLRSVETNIGSESSPLYVKKSLVPTSDQLRKLNLKPGSNVITFTVLYNGEHVSSKIFLWNSDESVIISDVDGTITRSDVLGHLLPRVGRDWSHGGIAGLYSSIEAHGFKFMYLTSRPIGQAGSTRLYIQSVVQDGKARLPEGPVVMSPDRLVASFTREVIRRRPDEFKIAALQQIRALFPPDYNPYYSGFGNRHTDARSYITVGVVPERIFTVNPKGELEVLGNNYDVCATYSNLSKFVDDFFPDITKTKGKHRVEKVSGYMGFNDFNYWTEYHQHFDIEQLIKS